MILDMEQIVNLSDADVVKRANAAVKIELEKKKRWMYRLLYMIGKLKKFINRKATELRSL